MNDILVSIIEAIGEYKKSISSKKSYMKTVFISFSLLTIVIIILYIVTSDLI